MPPKTRNTKPKTPEKELDIEELEIDLDMDDSKAVSSEVTGNLSTPDNQVSLHFRLL